MKYFFTFVSALLLFVSCSSDDETSYTDTKVSRAVMIYMAGENNLTHYNGYRALQTDLAEIVEGSKKLTNNQRLFVFVDSLGTNSQRRGKPYIIEVHGGKTTLMKQYDSEFYSCDPDKFREVISWMTTNIKADGFGLVLWGHATGWLVEPDTIVSSSHRAYGGDTNGDVNGDTSGYLDTKDSRWMNITQMAQALTGLPKFDYIFNDCCNMMCAEVGYELRNVTNYLIGSPAEIPGYGAPYDLIIPELYKNGSSLYKGIIDTYYNYYLEAYKNYGSSLSGYSVPLSVIDTKYIADLATATRNILSEFTDGYPTAPSAPDQSGVAMYQGYDSPVLYDMRAFIKKHVSASSFQQWDKAYQTAVPYYRMSMKWMTIYDGFRGSFNLWGAMDSFDQDASLYGCVSMFIPQDMTTYYTGHYAYNKTANNFEWNRIMNWSQFGWE